MADIQQSLERVMSVEGAVGAALVDSSSGFVLGKLGDDIDMQEAVTDGTTQVRTAQELNLNDMVEDILVTMGRHYHILRPLARDPALFLHVVLDKSRSTLATARLFAA